MFISRTPVVPKTWLFCKTDVNVWICGSWHKAFFARGVRMWSQQWSKPAEHQYFEHVQTSRSSHISMNNSKHQIVEVASSFPKLFVREKSDSEVKVPPNRQQTRFLNRLSYSQIRKSFNEQEPKAGQTFQMIHRRWFRLGLYSFKQLYRRRANGRLRKWGARALKS